MGSPDDTSKAPRTPPPQPCCWWSFLVVPLVNFGFFQFVQPLVRRGPIRVGGGGFPAL